MSFEDLNRGYLNNKKIIELLREIITKIIVCIKLIRQTKCQGHYYNTFEEFCLAV